MGFFARLLGRQPQPTKLAEVTAEVAQGMQDVPRRPDYAEVSRSGTRISGGRVLGYENNSDLQGTKWHAVVEDMLRTDPACASAHNALVQTLLSAKWSFVPGETPQSKRAAEFLNSNFGLGGKRGRLKGGWESSLRQLLRYVSTGVRYMEEVYTVADDHVWLSKFADREMSAHEEWLLDPQTGELAGVQQQDTSASKQGSKGSKVIPANKMILLIHNRTGDNFDGVGILRPCYVWHRAKVQVLDLLLVGAERWAVPTPLVTVDRDKLALGSGSGSYNDSQVNDLVEAAREQAELYTSHEAGHILTSAGIDFDTFGSGTFDPAKAQAVINLCDEQISSAYLLGFLRLGISDTGSRSVGEVHQSFFLRSCVNVLDQVASVVGGPAGPGTGTAGRLLAWNFPDLPESEYPVLTHSGLTPSVLVEQLANVMSLKGAGMLSWGPADEATVRPLLGLAPAVAQPAQAGV